MITGVHHKGITVSNLDRSIEFYRQVLGLELVTAPSAVFSGEDLSKGVGVPGTSLKLALLKAGEATLELLQYVAPESPIATPLPQNALGAQHVAFLVGDVDAAVKELEAKGVTFFTPVNVVDDGLLAGWRWVYFSDPDGIALELVEVAYTREEERREGLETYLASHKVAIGGHEIPRATPRQIV
jgi:catechol 2,3-dioxygenase-like lactoylglutathione lyase family enzyme